MRPDMMLAVFPGVTRMALRWAIRTIVGALALIALGLVVLFVLTWIRVSGMRPPGDARPYQVEGLTLYAIDEGARDAQQTVVLLSGQAGSFELWESIRPVLRHRYRVVIPERPGMGWSDGPPEVGRYHLRFLTDQVYRVLRQLDVRSPILVGFSYGGAVALQMAVEHPEFPAGLIHLAGVGPGWDLKKHYAANLIERGRVLTVPVLGFLLSWTIGPFLPSLAPETALKPMFGPDWENVSPGWIARNTEMRRRPNMIRNVMLEVHNAPVDLEPLRAEISKIKQPVMIIVAELDRNVSRDVSDYLSANLSNARLIMITRAAHLFPVVRSGQVVSVIDELANHVPKS